MSLSSHARGLKPLFCIALITLLAACATTSPDNTQPVKSPNDDYAYRSLTLDNGMQVLLISAPDTPKSAAALAVAVGSGDNPPGRGGLAHFLEHMLFLGTDKYPDPAEYAQYINEHGGSRNAYTSFEQTNYFFDVNPEYLPGALDRFAQFFIAPRFDAKYVEREKNAVQAEYQMGLKSDPRRGLDVLQEVMNPEHPYSQFSVGSLDTLADRPGSTIRDELLAFYDEYYSANAMRLVVLGAESLDELEALVTPMFSPVPNSDRQIPVIEQPLYAANSLPMLVQIKPLATQRQLSLNFPIPDYRADYAANPLSYLGNLLGHEGEGSLLSQLKAEGLAESLGAGSGLSWPGGSVFSLEVTLTEAGAANYERVLQLVFAYADMLREAGPRDWLYEEQSQLAELGFRYREHGRPVGYVTNLAASMHFFAPRDVLRGPYMMDDYDRDLLAGLLGYIRPDNVQVTLSDAGVTTDKVSVHYEVPYARSALDPAKLAVSPQDPALAALHLPTPNEFIAEDVSLVDLPREVPQIPQLAREEARQKVWFKQDEQFRVPKGVIYINFRTTEIGQSVEQKILARLYTALLTDRVNEYAYPALLAGLNFSIYPHTQGISLRVSGYNDKQVVLLEKLLSELQDANFDAQRFDNIRADMVRALENTVAKRPSSQVMDDLKEALLYANWSEPARIDALRAATPAAVREYVAGFWPQASAEALIFGNFEPGTVDEVSDLLADVLPAGPAPEVASPRVLKITAGENMQYAVDVPHDDSVVAWYLQGADNDWNDRAAVGMTGQIMGSGFFQELRTEQQLGYVVSAFAWAQQRVPGLVMLVQSPVADAGSVVDSMEAYLQGVIPALDAEQFERHRAALLSDILRPHKNIGERAQFYWTSLAYRQLDFAGREKLAQAVRDMTLEQWQDYFTRVFLEQRHSLQVVAPGKWQSLPQGVDKRFDEAGSIKASHDAYTLY